MRLFKLLETSYENFTETMQRFLNKTFGGLGQAYSSSSVFGAVFEGIKGVMQNMMFYIEDAMSEQNVFTATRKKSIYSLAKISGYEAFYGSAATGTVILSDKISNDSKMIVIQDGTMLRDSDSGAPYTINLPMDSLIIDTSKPLVSHEVKVIQGNYEYAQYVSKGEPIETLEVNVNGLFDQEYIDIRVNGEKYTIASCFYDMIEDEPACVVKNGYAGSFMVMFGDGYHGRLLDDGDQVSIRYIVHDGESGNLDNDATLEFSSSLKDVLGNDVDANEYINITINNYICGGSDSDTISDIRETIGMNSRSLVIANEDNFKMFLKRFSFVGQFNIITSKNSLDVICVPFARFKDKIKTTQDYLDMDVKDMLLTEHQKDMVQTALANSNKAFTGVSISFIDPIIRKYSIICYIKTSSSFAKDSVKDKIKNCISRYFMNLSTKTSFISKSDIISYVLDNISELTSFDIDFISEADEIARKNGWWYKKELRQVSGKLQYVDVRTIYDQSDMIGLDEVGNIRLNTDFEMPCIHSCNMTHEDWSQIKVDPIQFFFL